MRIARSLFLVLIASIAVQGQSARPIAEIQGDGNTSPFAGKSVRAEGVVTARIRTGFFIQTPDDKADKDPKTSEGIFVFTRTAPPAEAVVGNLVEVSGTLQEFRRDNEPFALTITEIVMQGSSDRVRVISERNALPKPIVLTGTDLMSNAVDSLERYEGMRFQIDELVVCSPTKGRFDLKTFTASSDGTFYGVIKPLPRPFREPGRDAREFATTADKDKYLKEFPKAKIFDSNPEVLRIDTDEQNFAPAQAGGPASNAAARPSGMIVAATTEVKGLVGVLHYSFGKYTLLTDPDLKVSITSIGRPTPLPAPDARQIVVAAMNLENFFDDVDDPGIKEDVMTPEAFARRLQKMSKAIVEFMRAPDVIGVSEAENLNGLKRLAAKLNADSTAAGRPDPKYEAFLIEGNDGRGIDNGFLIKTSRVKVIETRQFGKADKFRNANTREENFLNDRPPLMLRASVPDDKAGVPFEFTVIANHLKSFSGYNDPRQQDNVRLKKKLQAEFLAKLLDERQKKDPNERIILMGDLNFFQFNDGIADIVGTITGKPAAAAEVMMASPDLVERDMINLVDVIAAPQRYSYIFDGNAQVLDHILISETLRRHTTGFGYARINADYPEILRNDASRMERFSDHDPAIAYFTMNDLLAQPRQ
ncbi:MAG: hypothetical protein AB7Q37_02200 [Pyrinomonadaceae bacterium]